jgi:hypothetical protein
MHKKLTAILVFIAFTTACGGGSNNSSAEPIVSQNNPPVTSVSDLTVNEGDKITLTVTATDADGDLLTYRWEQLAGDSVEIQSSSTNVVFIAPDVEDVSELQFEVTVSDGKGSSKATVTVTINNVEEPELIMKNAVVQESNVNSVFNLAISLTQPYYKDISFNYTTQNGNAISDEDYIPVEGTQTIAAGDVSSTIAIVIIGDNRFKDDNDDEFFDIVLTNITNTQNTESTASITVINDDEPFVSNSFYEMPGKVDTPNNNTGVDNSSVPYIFDAGLANQVWLIQQLPYVMSPQQITQEMLDSDDSFNPFFLYTLDENNEIIDVTQALYNGDNTRDLHAIREAVAGDFNNDGREDLAFALNTEDGRPRINLWEKQNKILLSQADGTYELKDIITGLIDYSHSIATGDINNDGNLDLVIGSGANAYPHQNKPDPYIAGSYIAINDGKGNFSLSQSLSEDDGDLWGSVHIADIDNDGINEIITGGWISPYVRIFKKDTANVYQPVFKRQLIENWSEEVNPDEPWSSDFYYSSVLGELEILGIGDIKTADINEDGLLDLIVHAWMGKRDEYNPARDVQIWLNTGSLSFDKLILDSALTRYQSGFSIQLIDVNYDGVLDINFCSEAPIYWGLQSESVYFGEGINEFGLLNPFRLSTFYDDAACTWFSDITKDGILDILQVDSYGSRMLERRVQNVLVGQ